MLSRTVSFPHPSKSLSQFDVDGKHTAGHKGGQETVSLILNVFQEFDRHNPACPLLQTYTELCLVQNLDCVKTSPAPLASPMHPSDEGLGLRTVQIL